MVKYHKNITCPYCENLFARWANIKKHIEETHPGQEVPEWVLKEVENKRRQGQKRKDGTASKPKEICPKCGEYLKTAYKQENRKFVRVGSVCPSNACDHIIKDFVELGEENDE